MREWWTFWPVVVAGVVCFVAGVVVGFALWLESWTRSYGEAGGPVAERGRDFYQRWQRWADTPSDQPWRPPGAERPARLDGITLRCPVCGMPVTDPPCPHCCVWVGPGHVGVA